MPSGKKLIIVILSILIITSQPTFADWKENAKAIKISGGEDHTLVLTKNKFLWGCGENTYYQLGTGDNNDRWTLVGVKDGDMNTPSDYLEDINDMDAGMIHSLAVDVNGLVWAWGDNRFGQIGDNTIIERSNPVQVYDGGMSTPSGYLEDIIDVAAGRSGAHSVAVDANNFVWAWGWNARGQLGNAGRGTNQLTPVQVHGGGMGTAYLENIIAISAGEDHSIAMDSNGFVYTWGDNQYGKLGIASTGSYKDTPVKVLSGQQDPNDPNSFLQNIVAVDAGWDHCIALEELDPFDPNFNGYVYAWGRNSENDGYTDYGGQLGDGTEIDRSTPVKVLCGDMNTPSGYLENIIAVSAGDGHSMALDMYRNVWTWGDNKYGQLGNGTDDPCSLTAVKVVGPNGQGYLENIVAVSAGYWHCLAIDSDGTIWTWGKHDDGRLGLGNITSDVNTPHPIPVVYNITQQVLYFGLQDAIDNANNSGDVIEASPGTYFEDIDFLTKTITLKGTNPNNWDVVANTTIHGSGSAGVPAVTFNNNPNSVLAGFTITNGDYGIKCANSTPNINTCIIENNKGHGLYCLHNSSVKIANTKISGNGKSSSENKNGINSCASKITVSNCVIEDSGNEGIYCTDEDIFSSGNAEADIINSVIKGNGAAGVYCEVYNIDNYSIIFNIINCTIEYNGGEGIYNKSSSAFVENSIIRRNDSNGIYCYANNLEIEMKNNWIHDNAAQGVSIADALDTPVTILNNTVANNASYGIKLYYDDLDVTLNNCIIWGNGSNDNDNLVGIFESVTYSCIEGDYAGEGNITTDPCFMNATDPNNYHLSPDSNCIDAGDPNFTPDLDEMDIDGEPRVVNSRVDMGADEYYWSQADFNRDEIVNFLDYALFANAWQTDDPNISLDGDNDVDYNDLGVFCDDWLWQPAWTGGVQMEGMMMGEGMSQGTGLAEGLDQTVTAEQQPPQEVEPLDFEELINWLDGLWLDGELKEIMTEEEYLEFRKSIEEWPQ